MNKYRISIMCVLLIMVFLYMQGVIEITVVTNFAFTCTSLLFSISSVIDTFAKGNRAEEWIRFVIDTVAIAVAVLLPNLKNEEFITTLMTYFDSNALLLLALFFTLASQWASEIKQKDMKNTRNKVV